MLLKRAEWGVGWDLPCFGPTLGFGEQRGIGILCCIWVDDDEWVSRSGMVWWCSGG